MAELGFLEACESWRLSPRYFRSKLGGKPAWLARDGLPPAVDCMHCGEPLVFLLQLYAPGEEANDFHRTIYVFMCIKEKCLQKSDRLNKCIRVFRCQLPRINPYYSGEPAEEDPFADDSFAGATLCGVCGCRGDKQCGACKKIFYCSKSHQVLHWRGGHKAECTSLVSAGKEADVIPAPLAPVTFGFAEFHIATETEDLPVTTEKDYDALMEDYEQFVQNCKPTLQTETIPAKVLEKACTEYGDKVFRHFKKRISYAPKQVIRYDKDAEPLYVSSDNVPSGIPPCNLCGAARRFEFQIMPQVISFLKPEGLLAGMVNVARDIDFGTLLIYTCSRNCRTVGDKSACNSHTADESESKTSQNAINYVEEVTWKQSLSNK